MGKIKVKKIEWIVKDLLGYKLDGPDKDGDYFVCVNDEDVGYIYCDIDRAEFKTKEVSYNSECCDDGKICLGITIPKYVGQVDFAIGEETSSIDFWGDNESHLTLSLGKGTFSIKLNAYETSESVEFKSSGDKLIYTSNVDGFEKKVEEKRDKPGLVTIKEQKPDERDYYGRRIYNEPKCYSKPISMVKYISKDEVGMDLLSKFDCVFSQMPFIMTLDEVIGKEAITQSGLFILYDKVGKEKKVSLPTKLKRLEKVTSKK